jgi:hypothetical protein
MDDDWFEAHFGPIEEWARQGRTGKWGPSRESWSRLCVVLTQWGWDATGLNLDVQMKPASNFDKYVEQKVLVGSGKCM